jgi:hypothetical protein
MVAATAALLALCAFTGSVSAQSWTAEQQEIWKLEQQQWAMSAAKDVSWIDTMVHPNMRFWDNGSPMPRDKASLKHWSKYDTEDSTTLVQELFPIAVTVTGNVAVVQYRYRLARETFKKERKVVNGHYTDVLIKENGRWMFIAWEGGDDAEK